MRTIFFFSIFILGVCLFFLVNETPQASSAYREKINMMRGEISMHDNATATVITTGNTYTKITGTTVSSTNEMMDFIQSATGTLKYIGTERKVFHAGCTLSIKGAGANDIVNAVLYKNGTVNANNEFTGGTELTTGEVSQKLSGIGDIGSTAIHTFVILSQNDTLELAVKNKSDADDVTVEHMNLFLMEMGMP